MVRYALWLLGTVVAGASVAGCWVTGAEVREKIREYQEPVETADTGE